MLTLVTLPDASTFFTAITAWSDPIFQALLPFAYLIMGISIGVGIIAFIIFVVGRIFHHQ